MFNTKEDYKEFGKYLIGAVKELYPNSFFDIEYREHKNHSEQDWYIHSRLIISGNLRCEFRKWSSKPYFIHLFLGAKILLELDLTNVIESSGKYTWYLSKPTNKNTFSLFSTLLDWENNLLSVYRNIVRDQKEKFRSGFMVNKSGFKLASDVDKVQLSETFQNFINAIVLHYSQTQPATRKSKFEIDDAEAEEGYQEDKRYLFTKRNMVIVNKRKEMDDHTCQACGFKLKVNNKYVIECHHINQLVGGESRITNINDLICLCPTCHRIAHLKKPPYTISEIETLLKRF